MNVHVYITVSWNAMHHISAHDASVNSNERKSFHYIVMQCNAMQRDAIKFNAM